MTNLMRKTAAIASAVALAAIAVASAQASERPNDRAGMLGVGAASSPTVVSDVLEQAIAKAAPFKPADRAGTRGPVVVVAPPAQPVAATSDFQWGDASVGAGAVLCLLLLLGGAGYTIRHRGRLLVS